MVEQIRHRGPDGMEINDDSAHGLAVCRLSIFGDKNAPMIFDDESTGRKVLLNGEIYNYGELWDDLSRHGYQRKTNLETELIARLYDIHGVDFARLLKGMFAIAIVDQEKMTLVRDIIGIKPLYYQCHGKRVIVSSEIKGLLAHPDASPSLNIDSLEETSVFGYVVNQRSTFFNNVQQVEPGTVLTFVVDGSSETTYFGNLPAARYFDGDEDLSYEEALLGVREKLISAVERLFKHGKMQKGVYLSGGIDSSIISLIAKELLGYDIQTFSLADSIDSADIEAGRKVANALGTDHHEWIVTAGEYWKSLPDYIAHYESMMAGGVFHVQGGVAFHMLSEKVAQNVKVAFSGEGADELFGGYYWIYTHPLGFSDRIRINLKALLPNPRMEEIVENLFPQPEDERTYRRNIFDHLIRGGLSNYHLQSVDRSAGAFGFEIRPLYLYNDVVDYALSLPIDFKVPDKVSTKKILRDAFRADFEECGLGWVLTRPKLGMPDALSKMDRELTARVERAISDEEFQRHKFGKILGSKMNLLLYDSFEQIFFNGWEHHNPEPPSTSFLSRVWQR